MKTRHGKSIVFFVAAVTVCVLTYVEKKNSGDPLDLAKINEFYQSSGLGPFPENKIIYFKSDPPEDVRSVVNFNVILKLDKNEAAKIAENFLTLIATDSPPVFASDMKQQIPKANSYFRASGSPRGRSSSTSNMTLTIGDYSDFSYVYIYMIHKK
jgi:hypothetical protein